MLTRKMILGMTAAAGMIAVPVLAFGQGASSPRDGTPGNPPSTVTGRAVDRAQGQTPRADGTRGNPPGTAAGRTVDRALGTNTTGANPPSGQGAASGGGGPAR